MGAGDGLAWWDSGMQWGTQGAAQRAGGMHQSEAVSLRIAVAGRWAMKTHQATKKAKRQLKRHLAP